MGLESPFLRGEAGTHAFRLNQRRERDRRVCSGSKPKPHHAHRPPAPKRADVSQSQLERGRRPAGDRIGHALHHLAIDAADKTHGEVKVLKCRPTEAWRDPRAFGDEAPKLFTLTFGHGQPEEGADPQRLRVFFQCSWAHVLGRVGRQP